MRRLVKPWNKLPAGAGVTLDPAEQVVLVDKDRLALLENEGHLVPAIPPEIGHGPGTAGWEGREIPKEVRTSGDRVNPPGFGPPAKTMLLDRKPDPEKEP